MTGMLTALRHEPAVQRRRDLLGDDHARAVLRLLGRCRQMRRRDDVVQLEQRARCTAPSRTRRARLRRPCPTSAPRAGRPRRPASPRAALTIRTPSRIFPNAFALIEPARLVRQRQMQREEVRSRVDLSLASRRARPRARGTGRARRMGRRRRPACRAPRRGGRPAGRSGRSRERRVSCRRARPRRRSCAPSGPA